MFTGSGTKRPKAGETEEDILEEEKEFLESLRRSGIKGSFVPAAQVIKSSRQSKHGDDETTQKKNSNVLGDNPMSKEEEGVVGGGEAKSTFTPAKPLDMDMMVGFSVQEREFDPSKLQAFSGQKALPKVSLVEKPKVSLVEKPKSLFAQGKKKSLFAQSFDAAKEGGIGTSKRSDNANRTFKVESKKPVIGDMIHPYLSGMTQDEILEEQRKLLERLDPKLISFIKNRSKIEKKSTLDEIAASGDVEMNVERAENTETPVTVSSELPIDPRSVEGIPGMDKIELDKLAWTGCIREDVNICDKPKKECDARFDFNGDLLPSDACVMNEKTLNQGLHNHGEEMERPGYTIEELLHLIQSTYTRQKQIAIKTIGNIFEKAHSGIYDRLFEKSFFELIDYMDFMHSIRKAIDETETSLIDASLECISKIIYPAEEEYCLDLIYFWEGAKPHPLLVTKSQTLDFSLDADTQEDELKDTEILKSDLLEFMISRSDILDRIEFFLIKNSDLLREKGVISILKILIRIARHSPNTLLKRRELLQCIISNYASNHWMASGSTSHQLKGFPLPYALKVIRILIDSSARNARELYYDFNIFPSILSYLAYDDWNSEEHVKMAELIIIESFRIWVSLISHGFAIQEYSSFFPVIMKFLTFYQSTNTLNSFDLFHSTGLISVILAIVRMSKDTKGLTESSKHSHWNLVKDTISFVDTYAVRLLTVYKSSHLNELYNENVLLSAITSSLRLLNEASKFPKYSVSEEMKSLVASLASHLVYSNLTKDLLKSSALLNQRFQTLHRYPSNFASLNSVQFGGQWNPVMQKPLTFPFLSVIYEFVDLNNLLREQFFNPNVMDYVNKFSQLQSTIDSVDFFSRFEILFVYRLATLFEDLTVQRFTLSYKALSETPKCASNLFSKLFRQALSSSCSNMSDKENCFLIYSNYLIEPEKEKIESIPEDEAPLKKKVKFDSTAKQMDGKSESTIEFESWNEKAIETNWILEPLTRMHTIVTSVPGYIDKQMNEIETHVRIILQLLHKCLENYVDVIVSTKEEFVNFYCDICRVFMLGDPGVYLSECVQKLLRSILLLLIRCKVVESCKNKPIFSKIAKSPEHPDLFLDLYPQLIKEYAGNSYFNEIFAAYLMIPLRAPEDSQLKCNFWTMDCLNHLRFNVEQSHLPLSFLTTEVEENKKMLDIYTGLLIKERLTPDRNGFLFEVAKYHLQNSALSLDKNVAQLFSRLHVT